ncbi:MAG TPA: type II toxin-antitoxin system prevent-host-death family antitoxin [Rhodanobacteraceae bacterium]|nr:type II toxin-antitoxin system prevent-host-death family antitoxin [Rhodanobacteraceae bacterium]
MSVLHKLDALPRTPASDLKKLGWRGVMKSVDREGKVVVTNHNEPEAVILSMNEYNAIALALEKAESKKASALDVLRQRFDERLASLQSANAGDRLRAAMRSRAKLGGKLKAAKRY